MRGFKDTLINFVYSFIPPAEYTENRIERCFASRFSRKETLCSAFS